MADQGYDRSVQTDKRELTWNINDGVYICAVCDSECECDDGPQYVLVQLLRSVAPPLLPLGLLGGCSDGVVSVPGQ